MGLGGAACFLEEPVGGGRAEREELDTNLVGEGEVTMLLEEGDELGEKGHQALGADKVGGSPGDFESSLDGGSISRSAGPPNGGWRRERRVGQQADGVLAGIAG